MKTLVSVIALLSSLVAFAGPEDHIQAQVCYNLSAKQIATKGEHIPLQICVEDAHVNVDKGVASIYSYFNQQYFQDVKVDSLVRQTEDTYRLQLSSVIYNDWQTICGDGETVVVKIKADSDFNGVVQKDQLKVTVEQEFTNDSCHSPAWTTEYIYSL